jgi:hypothetical protein
MKRLTFVLGALFVPVSLLTGCAGAPLPTAKVASSAAAIRAAQELQAVETPTAQLRLQYAQDEYGKAQKLIAAGDNETAERMLARAEADAELAVAIAKQVRSEKAMIAAQAEVQTVNSK